MWMTMKSVIVNHSRLWADKTNAITDWNLDNKPFFHSDADHLCWYYIYPWRMTDRPPDTHRQPALQITACSPLIKITNLAHVVRVKGGDQWPIQRDSREKKLNSRITKERERVAAGTGWMIRSVQARLHLISSEQTKKQFTYTIWSRSDKGGKFHWFLFL